MATEAQKRAIAKYDQANTIQVKLKLNKHHDKDIIERLDQVGNKSMYITGLIRDDIEKSPRE